MFESIINPRCQSVNTISNNNNDMVRSSTLMDVDMITLSDLIEEQTAVRSGRKFLDKPTQNGMPLTRARPGIRDLCCNPRINK